MENNETKQSPSKNVLSYLKKYSYYFALAGLVLILSIAIVVTSAFASDEPETEQTNAPVLTFDLPVLNATAIKGFSATELQYNATLNVWETHKGVDFYAEVGTNVLASADGKVTSISTNILDGTVIEIDHGNGIKTTYGSLDSEVSVKVGDVVSQGDIIGKASNTATSETLDEGQVHFEVWKDGNLVDPANYMDISYGK